LSKFAASVLLVSPLAAPSTKCNSLGKTGIPCLVLYLFSNALLKIRGVFASLNGVSLARRRTEPEAYRLPKPDAVWTPGGAWYPADWNPVPCPFSFAKLRRMPFQLLQFCRQAFICSATHLIEHGASVDACLSICEC
jgi:hypothetical protein